MYYSKVECPHCGNELVISNAKEVQKCCWCKRLISIKFKWLSKKKQIFTVEPMDFSEVQKKEYYNKWKDEDINGHD
jgi:hypothetical protein